MTDPQAEWTLNAEAGTLWSEERLHPPRRGGTGVTGLFDSRGPSLAERSDDRSDRTNRALEEADRPPGEKDGPRVRKEQTGRQEESQDDKPKKGRSKLPFIILGVVVLLTIIGGTVYYFITADLVSTDDAYTEGRAVLIAAKVAGYSTQLLVDDNTPVKAGDVLLRIDPRDYVIARDQARANLKTAQAQLLSAEAELEQVRVRAPATLQQAQAQLDQARSNKGQAERDFKRQQKVDPRATTQQNIDQASSTFTGNSSAVRSSEAQVQIASVVSQTIADSEAAVKQRQGQVEQNEAALAQAELNLSYTEIHAPQDGRITMRNVELGTYIQVGQQIFYVVTPDTWVVANFKEAQLARMRPGQPVSITVDAYPHMKLRGHVDSIQQGSGARFSAFPAQNATGNFVKIVRRVPVKIILESGYDRQQGIPLGISVQPTVTVE